MLTTPKTFVFLLFLSLCFGDETYQNSSNICSTCSCKDDQTFTLDCTNQNFFNMLASFPSPKPMKVIFTGNNFTNLEKIPPIETPLEIVLSHCGIVSIDPGVFDSAIQTKSVDLSYNLLTSEELRSDRFRGPFKDNKPEAIAIEHLDLSHNQIHSLHKDLFEFLPNLKWLSLEGNKMSRLDVHTQLALNSLPELTSLNLGSNGLTEIIHSAINNLKLEELDLSWNDLDFVPFSLEAIGDTLQVLVLDGNPIFEMTNETFPGLVRLREISGNNLTKLERIEAGTFSPTVNLATLHLCNATALYMFHPQAFSPKATLRNLFLTNTNLSTLPLSLLKWSQLTTLDLSGNTFNCSCDLFKLVEEFPSGTYGTCNDSTMAVRRVNSLTSDICEAKVGRVIGQIRYHHISIPLAGLIVCLMVALMAAVFMSYSRYRRFLGKRDDGFGSEVMYSPLLTGRA